MEWKKGDWIDYMDVTNAIEEVMEVVDPEIAFYIYEEYQDADLFINCETYDEVLRMAVSTYKADIIRHSERTKQLILFDKVSRTENLEELACLIEELGGENKAIQGLTEVFKSDKMAENCRNFSPYRHSTLTRQFGIRQQALMFDFYNNKIPSF